VQIRHQRGMVQLKVVDDGVGFYSGHTKGFGLSNIRQRIEHLNGRMRIVSKPGEKTVMAVVVPMNPDAAGPTRGAKQHSLLEAPTLVLPHSPPDRANF